LAKHAAHILEMARKGAEHKYEELKAEIATLIRHFPHLVGGTEKGRVGGRVAAVSGVRHRRRKPMSAAAKKAVSERMKKYWAKRRASKGA
jgi:hypothetical protein